MFKRNLSYICRCVHGRIVCVSAELFHFLLAACRFLCVFEMRILSCECECEKLFTLKPKAASVFGCSANNVCEFGQCSFGCSKTHIKNGDGDGGAYAKNCHSPHDFGYFPSTRNLHMLSFIRSFVYLLACFSMPLCVPQYKRVYLRFYFKTNVVMNHQAP